MALTGDGPGRAEVGVRRNLIDPAPCGGYTWFHTGLDLDSLEGGTTSSWLRPPPPATRTAPVSCILFMLRCRETPAADCSAFQTHLYAAVWPNWAELSLM